MVFESNALLQTLLFIFSFALFGRGVSLWVNTIFKAHEASEYVLYQESIFRLLEVILGITLLNLGYGIVPLALVHSCLWVIQGAVGIILLKKYTLPFQMNWDGMVMINYMIKGIPFILSAFLISWIFQGPLILFRHSSGIGRDMGYVALALQAFFIISAVVAELGGAATPVVSRSVNRKDGKSDHYIDAVLRFGIFIGSLLVLASMSIADPMINFFLGADYSPVLKLLPFSLVLVTPYFWITSLRSIIVAHGRYWIIALNYLVGAVFFTISFYVFIEPLKHLGIMAALGLGLLMVAVMHLLTISKLRQEIDLMSSIIKPLIGMFISIAFCIAFCPVNPWISFIACTVLFFLLELILGGIKKHEILTVFKIVSGIKIFAK